MKIHWGFAIVVLLIGYALAMYFPGPGAMVRAKLGV